MKLYEYADQLELPNGKLLDQSDKNSYPIMYFDDMDFYIGDEGGSHMSSMENYFDRIGDNEYRDIRHGNDDLLDDFLYRHLENATYTGRVWLDHKAMAFWDLNMGANDRARMKDVIKNLEEEFNIKIDPKEWWVEFSDTQTGIPYFVILNDFIKNKNLKYGMKDEENQISFASMKAWHLLNSAEKIKLKTQYGMNKYKMKNTPLAWKQAKLKSESVLNESPDYVVKFNKRFYDDDSLAFGYYNGTMYVNPKLHGDHDDLKDVHLIRNDFKYPGRLWLNDKIISFWKYPIREEFPLVIQDIENASDVKFDGEWIVEVVDDSMGYKDSDFVPFDEYYGSPDWSDEEINTEHITSPMLKTKKKPTYYKKISIEDRHKRTTSESMKTFEEYNESLRDKMTPKSEEDIKNNLLKKQPEQIAKLLNTLKYRELFTDEEIRNIILNFPPQQIAHSFYTYQSIRKLFTEEEIRSYMKYLSPWQLGSINTKFFRIQGSSAPRENSLQGCKYCNDVVEIDTIYDERIPEKIQMVQFLCVCPKCKGYFIFNKLSVDFLKSYLRDQKTTNPRYYIVKDKKINESLKDKMIPKSEEDVINGLSKIKVGIDEYTDVIKNSILRYLEKNNIDVNDIMIIDDGEALDFIRDLIQYNTDSEYFEETDAEGMYFSYFNFFKDNIILMGDDSGELDVAIIYDINKFKEKLNPQKNKTKNIVEYNKFSLSLPINTNNNSMEQIIERVEAKMDLPQDIIKFQKLFEKKGYKLYVVGGAVRDYLMGKKPHDFDMVTDTTPQNVMDVLKDYRTDLQGVHFGVVRVFTQAEPDGYEIASYRKDISKGRDTKGNDPKVEIGQHITIKDDVKRRDLTMNALFYNIRTGEIVDVVGGIRDIQNKVVRAVGNPQKRFNEDRLRILRALRFAAVTDSKLHPKTEKAIRKDSRLFDISDVDDVSRERIFLEFKKVKEKARANDDPKIIKRFVDDLIEYGIMEQIFPVITKHKTIRPTTYLTVAIAQVLRDNEITPEFKEILIDARIPTDFVEIISILIKIWREGGKIDPNDVYELYKEVRNKSVRRDILEDWIDVMNMNDKSLKTFLKYVPTTPGKEVMDDGFKGANIGHEIRRREAEKFKKMLNSNK